MKTIGITIWAMALGIIMFLFASCDKDETKVVVNPTTASVLTASKTAVVLTKDDATKEAVLFEWTPSDFGYNAATTNALEVSVKGDDFKNAKEVAIENGSTNLAYTTAALNALALSMELPTDQESDLEIRLKSSVSTSVPSLLSNVVPLTVTPYATVSYVYIVGAFQNWVIEEALPLVSATSNGIYVGVFTFPEANSKFKITLEKNWTNSYGDNGDGKIVLNGGSDIGVPRAGKLEMTVNTNNNTISYKDAE